MLTTSPEFLAACRTDQRTTVTATLVDLASGDTLDLPVLDGQVVASRMQAIRRRGVVRVPDDARQLVPVNAQSPTAPYRTELHLTWGLRLPDGTVETVPLAVLRLDRASTRDTGNGVVVELAGRDRAVPVKRARRTSTWTIDVDTPLEQAITDAILDRDPTATFNLPTTGDTVGGQVVWVRGPDSAPLEEVQRLALSYGFELYVGPDGAWTMREPAGRDDPSVLDVVDGVGGTLVDVDGQIDTGGDDAYNGVQAESSAVDLAGPVLATVWDDVDVNSPTYRPVYGDVPSYFTSPLLRTVGQAQRAATSILRGLLGREAELQTSILPNPAVEPGDPWTVTREPSGLVAAAALVDEWTLPLDGVSVMQVDARRRFV